jgi:hypothetical protein
MQPMPFRVAALDATVGLEVGDPGLADRLASVFAAMATDVSVGHLLTVACDADGTWVLDMDGQPAGRASTFAGLVDALVMVLNRTAVAETARLLLLHGAAAERDGRAIILPAPSGSGKTTLVNHLAGNGFGYVADEIVAVDPETLRIVAYPKPFVLEATPGELELCVHPPSGRSVEAGVIVMPRYIPGGGGVLRPLRRSQAVLRIADNAFNFHLHGAEGLRTLAGLARRCATYELDVDDLDVATNSVTSALIGTPC